MLKTTWWRERLYPDRARQNPFARFMRHLSPHVRPGSSVLDIGAGAGEINVYDFKGRCGEMVGVDVDRRVETNPLLDRGVCADAGKLPFEDARFDVAFSVYVLEHVADPGGFVSEVARVLKPGGVFVSLTPNRRHYVALGARLTPTRFHAWYNQKRGRDEEDTFPTCYKLNTLGSQRRHFAAAGFDLMECEQFEVEPKYLLFSLPTFLAGVLYERVVNATDLLAGLRVNMVTTWRKSSAQG